MYISQCLIAKNEEENIEYCLSHLKSVVNEQIVIDTGSTDRTVEIAESLGAKVFHFEWIDDFSAARNYALDKAKGSWIIFLDCDEYFDDNSIPLIKNYIEVINGEKHIDGILSEFINIDKDKNVISTVKNISARIFRNKENIRYKNKIHEFLADLGRKEFDFNVVCYDGSKELKILHTGYDKTVVREKNKNERNITMLKKELSKNPEDLKLNVYVSQSLYMNGEYMEALNYGLQSLKYMDKYKDEEYYPLIYRGIMSSMYSLAVTYDGIKSIFDQAIIRYSFYPDYYMIMGMAALLYGRNEEAADFLEKCIYYCSSYNSNVESIAIGQINHVYGKLLKAYILSGNKLKTVEVATALLSTDRYDFKTLTALLETLLTGEKQQDIIIFLSKIYDYDKFKDKIYLLKACNSAKTKSLRDYYMSILNESELEVYNNSGLC
ncbi:glycosyltransferase family 2 protein [Sedimentibacter sp.]|uniref:glycosyltransferase family 2 protein n=1 Tax=Sedimentibacter sp. TaxID=1960295 RepID=UPI0028AED129|nr:glycosyltransferase family 2 protein [Sedimentibacter sp.]